MNTQTIKEAADEARDYLAHGPDPEKLRADRETAFAQARAKADAVQAQRDAAADAHERAYLARYEALIRRLAALLAPVVAAINAGDVDDPAVGYDERALAFDYLVAEIAAKAPERRTLHPTIHTPPTEYVNVPTNVDFPGALCVWLEPLPKEKLGGGYRTPEDRCDSRVFTSGVCRYTLQTGPNWIDPESDLTSLERWIADGSIKVFAPGSPVPELEPELAAYLEVES